MAKGFTVGRPRRRPDGDRPDGKHALCRVPFIGHTAKASPCVFDDTRRKKEETARRRRNGRERRGGRLRREPNQTHGKQFQKNKKNQPAAPTAGRTPGAAAGETRGRGAAAGWRERKPPPEAPAPDLEGRRILHLRSSVRRAPSMEEEAAPPCAVVGEGGRPAVRRRWEEEAGRRSPPSPDLSMRRRPRPPLLAPPPLLTVNHR